jgi:hypothetical protein
MTPTTAWCEPGLFAVACLCALRTLVAARLVGTGRVVVYLDDTLFHHNGSIGSVIY